MGIEREQALAAAAAKKHSKAIKNGNFLPEPTLQPESTPPTLHRES
jgi:hypothetical protein